MNKRPQLNIDINVEEFMNYYYLKEELVQFCRAHDLQTTGGKEVLTKRIAAFLKDGTKEQNITKKTMKSNITSISEYDVIEENIICSEIHRDFFQKEIGPSFKFKVAFQTWLKQNAGKTYHDAIQAYNEIINHKGQTVISKQFEYNTYIRDFFEANKGYSLSDAILCWKTKKAKPGHNRYEEEDLKVLLENKNQ